MNNEYNLSSPKYQQQDIQSQKYHKIARNLKKKSHVRQNKLIQAPAFQQQTFKETNVALQCSPSLVRQYRNPNPKTQQGSVVRSLTEVKKKQKQNKSYEQFIENNIFKLPSSQILNKINKEDIRLPVLDKKKSTFEELNEMIENPEKRRVVRISIEKLKPLLPEEVKRRFMMKYHLESTTHS